jgi:hypothetical protein
MRDMMALEELAKISSEEHFIDEKPFREELGAYPDLPGPCPDAAATSIKSNVTGAGGSSISLSSRKSYEVQAGREDGTRQAHRSQSRTH